jgi:hypothetical protein
LPFWIVYDRDPSSTHEYTPDDARLPAVHSQLMEHDEFLMEIRERLVQALQQYKMYYDR